MFQKKVIANNDVKYGVFKLKDMPKMIAVSILVAIASQVNLELLESNFVVSAGVIFLVIFLYHYEDINPVPFGIISGTMVFLFRLTVHQIMSGDVDAQVTYSYMPEIIFYAVYAIFFLLFLEKNKKSNLGFTYVVCIISDFASNLFELFVRYTIFIDTNLLEVIPTLIIVSVIRSSVVWMVLTALNYYNMMLTTKEHEDRYKRLLLLTSQLKTEMYWIEKNMDNLEMLMEQSNSIYEEKNYNLNMEKWADITFTIIEDIKEIKKYNALVVRGIKEVTEKGLKDRGMEYKDINNILSEIMKVETKNCNKNIEFEFDTGNNFYTSEHYYLISILRNLILNSIDSIRRSQKDAKISVNHQVDEQQHTFEVTDNGCGIEEEHEGQIFKPGFSTKVNNETGEVCRGLGLSIVQYIVEQQFKGKIEVNSKTGIGTTVVFRVPKKTIEEEAGKVIK